MGSAGAGPDRAQLRRPTWPWSPTPSWSPPGRADLERAEEFAAEFGGVAARLLRGPGRRPLRRRRVRRLAARPARRAHPAGPRGRQARALREADDPGRRVHRGALRGGRRPGAVPDGGHVDGLQPAHPHAAQAAGRRASTAPHVRSTPASASWSRAPGGRVRGRLLDPALGGGALLDMGIYPLTFAHLVLGEPEQLAAVANLSPGGIDLDVSIAGRYPGGATAALTATLTSHASRDRLGGDRDRPLRRCRARSTPRGRSAGRRTGPRRAPASWSSPTSR